MAEALAADIHAVTGSKQKVVSLTSTAACGVRYVDVFVDVVQGVGGDEAFGTGSAVRVWAIAAGARISPIASQPMCDVLSSIAES